MDGLENKFKLDKKTTPILIGGVLVVVIGLVIYLFASQAPPQSQSTGQNIVTKTENKTYLKYVALDKPTQPVTPTNPVPTHTPTPTGTSGQVISPTGTGVAAESSPSPTEIILTSLSPTANAEAVATGIPSQVAQLPTTGMIEGSLAIFLVSLSLIVFAFAL